MDESENPVEAAPAGSAEDVRALGWVQDEVRRSLESAQKAVQRHLREAESLHGSDLDDVDPSVLRGARTHLHQAAGALDLVGLQVPAMLVRAGEQAVQHFVGRPGALDAGAAQALERAWFALGDYLGRLAAGKPVSGVSLFPQYRALMELSGADRIHPADLWEHDWRWRVVAREADLEPRAADVASRELMERLILRLMRTPDRTTLRRMSDLCASLGAEAKGRRATMWRLAAGFFEAQACGLLRQDVYVKRAAPRLLAQARLGMRAGEVSDRLARDLLFFCAQALDPGESIPLPRLRAVRQAYGLPRASLPDYEVPTLGRFDPAWLVLARKRVNAARDAWAAAAGGEPLRAQGLSEAFALLRDSLERLYPNGDALGQALTRAVQSVGAAPSVPPPLAMEVATAVLYLEASLEEASLEEPELAERIVRLASRIDAVRQGEPPQPLESWMAELYRRVSDSQTMGSVVHQLRGMLAETEQALDRHYREPALGEVLTPVPGWLGSMRGVLSVLGLDAATRTVQRMREDVEQLARDGASPSAQARDAALFDRLADNLGALGFLVDVLATQPVLAKAMFRFEPEHGRLRAWAAQAGRDATLAEAVAETGSGDLNERLQRLAGDARRAEVSDEMLGGELRSLVQHAMLAEERRLAEALGDVQARLAGTADPAERRALREDLASWPRLGATGPVAPPAPAADRPTEAAAAAPDTSARVAQVSTEAGPGPQAAPSAPPPPGLAPPGADDEMLGVFLEESAEVISQARAALARLDSPLRDAGNDLAEVAAVRRAFHTLKGSSRMVGLADFGEAAWACEQLYNARLARAPVSMDAALRAFSLQALAYLEGWTQAIGSREARGHVAGPVVEAADALRLESRVVPLPLPTLDTVVEEPPIPPAPAGVPMVSADAAAVPVPPAEPAAAVVVSGEPAAGAERAVESESEAEAGVGVSATPMDAWRDEPVKVVGPLRVEIAVFNIFLNEADELSRRLSTRLAEWATEPLEPPGEAAVVLAHSLAGSSATVGFADLAALSRALEQALMRGNAAARVSEGEVPLFTQAGDDIRRMLHQFAAGFLVAPREGLVERLEAHRPEPAAAAPAAVAPAVVAPALPSPAAEPVVVRRPGAEEDIDLEDAVDAELLPVFVDEADEHLPQLQARMREWVERPAERAAADACMRTLHTFKGAARLAGAMRLGEMAHRLETAIEQLLAAPAVDSGDVEPLVWRVDALEAAFEELRDAAGVAPERAQPVHGAPASAPGTAPSLPMLAPAPAIEAQVPAATAAAPAASPATAEPAGAIGIDWSRLRAAADTVPQVPTPGVQAGGPGAVRVKSTLLDRLVNHAGEASIARTRIESDLAQIKASLADLSDNLERLRRQLRDVEVQAESQISSRLEAAKAAAVEFDPLEMDRYTRVQELTRMMAESVNDVATVQRSLQRALQSSEDQIALQGRVTRALQDDLMRTRMVEFESLSDRLYRVLRQTAKETGKQVRLDIVGGSMEIDRSVLERMTAPFEHLLRNSVVHGVEDPALRAAAGKDPSGLVEIRLTPEGNEVAIEFRDDGAGLDLARIRERARAMGLVPPGASLTDAAVIELVFMPGFSTAERVTEIAGRGVGMDVVRSEVLALGGRIQTASTPGGGTAFRLVLPLTTAVTQVVMLRCGERRVAVPANLVEVVLREPAEAVDAAYRSGVWPLAGESLPFHWLGGLLDGEAAGPAAGRGVPVVIVRSAAQRVAIHVDEVLGHQEVVVKNLGPQLARLPGLAGITALASGTVAPIYNPVALVACYGELARRRVRELLQRHPGGGRLVDERPAAPPAPLVLVVDDSLTVRRVTQRLLAREGYRVAIAKDGVEALERLAHERPRVILCDIEMPRMDGFEFVRKLRADPALAALPVVMITSRIAQKHRDYARELGIEHYLGKPYGEEQLLALVARLSRRELAHA